MIISFYLATYKKNLFLDHTYPVDGPRVTLLTQVVLHLSLQPHAVKVLPDLQEQKQQLNY